MRRTSKIIFWTVSLLEVVASCQTFAQPAKAGAPARADARAALPDAVSQVSVALKPASAAPKLLTLLEALKLAKANDPKFKAAVADSYANEQILDQARAGFLPTIRADFERTSTNQEILSSSNSIFGEGSTTFPTTNRTLSISQPIYRLDLIKRLAQARATVRQAQFNRIAAEQDLLQRTASAYLMVLAAQDNIELARTEKDSLRRQLDLAEGRLKGGLGTVTVLYDVSSRHAVSLAREIEAENKMADAKQGLREIIDGAIEKSQRLREVFKLELPDPVDIDRWVVSSIEQNLSLRARTEAVEVALQELERQRAGHAPSLSLLANRNERNSGSTLFGGGSNMATMELTLRLSVPIYEGGMVNSLSKEAMYRYQSSMAERELELRSVERQARAAFQSVVSGISLVQALQQSVRSQQSAFEAKEVGARTGVYTPLQVLDAQRELFTARRDYAQARYDYLLSTLKLKQVAGTLSEQDIGLVHAALE